METLLIESNRDTAVSLVELDDETVPSKITVDPNVKENKSTWSTIIDPLILQAGDQISLESASINIKGIGDGEKYNSFTGSVQTNTGKILDKKDNFATLEINYYINNNNQFTIPLPLGTATRCDSRGGFFTRATFGCPSLTGKNIWGTLFEEYEVGVPYTATTEAERRLEISSNKFVNMNSYNYQWSMGRGQYFYTTQGQSTTAYDTEIGDYSTIEIKQTDPTTLEKKTTCEIAGYLSWTNNVPIWGLQGTQFHQSVGIAEDTINQNISNKDTGIFVKDLVGEPAVIKIDPTATPTNTIEQGEIPSIQGGASPYQILPGGIFNDNAIIFSKGQTLVQLDGASTNDYYSNVNSAVAQCQNGNYQYSLAKIAKNCLPYDLNDLKEGKTIEEGRFVYNDPMIIESTRYKGGLNTCSPNGQKLFCPNYIDENLCNLGPYYNAITNDTRPRETTPSSSLLFYRDYTNNNRNSNYFNYLKQEINLEVPEGNISSQRVADLLTEELKDRQGTTDNLSNGLGISPAIYTTFPKDNIDGFQTDVIEKDLGVAKKILPTIASKTYQSFPTLTGLIWETAYKSQYDVTLPTDADPDRFNLGWNCIEPEVVCKAQENMGSNYDANQAYNKYWKLMLCGNPNEWKSICWLNPMIQSTPMTQFQLTDIFTSDDFQKYSIYTGQIPEFIGTNNSGDPVDFTYQFRAIRKANNGTKNTTSYMVGQYGCQSCLLEGGENLGKNNILVSESTRAFMCDWYLGAQVHTKTLSSTEYDTYGRSARSAIFSKPLNRLKYKPIRLEMFVTNIIYDGNIDISIINDNYDLLTKIEKNENSQNNILSQSANFFDSNYVEWVVGRIDDAYSYPGTLTHNISTYENYVTTRSTPTSGLGPPTPNRVGVPRFLPNIFQTYKLYLQQPYNNQIKSSTDIPTNLSSVELSAWKERTYVDNNGVNRTVGGNYAFCNESIGTEIADMRLQGDNTKFLGQTLFAADNDALKNFCYDETVTGNTKKKECGRMVFGIPCYSTSADDYIPTPPPETAQFYKQSENKNQNPSLAYQKGLRRKLKGFRYLPQIDNNGNSIDYWSANNAWNENILLPQSVSAKFTTRPTGNLWTEVKFKELWNKLLALNEGKGIGCIPLFYKKSALAGLKQPGSTTDISEGTANIPFLAVILTGNQEEILLPETGESISLGTSPSLSQNTLAMPCSTQQVNLQTDLQKLGNTPLVQSGETDVRNNYYQQNVGVQDAYHSRHVDRTGDSARGVPQSNVRTLNGFVPSKSTNLTQFLGSGGKTYSPVINIGANDPAFEYDAQSERFSLNNLHTAMTQGNGVFQLASFGANASPETQIETAYVKTSAFSAQVNLPCGYFQKKMIYDLSQNLLNQQVVLFQLLNHLHF